MTLALGIGAATAMFSVVYTVLLRPFPVSEPERLVTIHAGIPHLNISGAFIEYNTFVDWWRPKNTSFESLAAFSPASAILDAGGQPQSVHMLRVSSSYFGLIGVQPALGRDFVPEEDRPGARRVAILGDGLWKRRFGAQRGVLGRVILLDKNEYTIVGVLSPAFDLDPADVYMPIAHSGARVQDMPSVGTYGRLRRGVTLQAAQADIDKLCHGWVRQYHYPQDWGARVAILQEYMTRDVRPGILLLSAAVGLVLLIACANVANLLLARAGDRQREFAIRGALGIVHGRIVRQLLTESALLGAIGTAVGVLLAWAATRVIVAADVPVPFAGKLSMNTPVLGFSIAVTLLTIILFGLAPALAAGRGNLASQLKEGGRTAGEGARRTRFRAILVAGEVALAMLLAVGAALTSKSLVKLLAVDPGFNPQSVLTASVTLPDAGYSDPSRRASFFQMLLQRLSGAPGVTSAGIVSDLPFCGSKSGNDIVVEGAPARAPEDRSIAFVRTADPDFFRTLQIRLRRGRFFTQQDFSGPPIAVVNETMARRCWPGEDPVGKRFAPGSQGGRPPVWLTVAGVIADMRNTALQDQPDLEYFLPYAMNPQSHMSLAVRTALDPLRLASAIRMAVGEIDKGLPVSDVDTLVGSIAHSTKGRKFSTTLLGIFALLALLLASVGIYGLVSYSVARRTHEIGVRMALGAAPGRITASVVEWALLLCSIGIGIGIAASLALTRLLRSMLFGVSATDPKILIATALFLVVVSAGAAYAPTRKASRVDPMVALYHE